MADLGSDLRHSLRSLLRSPGFTTLAVLVLALGLGANLLLFNAVQALLWRPLPFPDPQRLVCIQGLKENGEADRSASGFEANALGERATLLADLGVLKQWMWDAPLADRPDTRLSCAIVSSGYLRVLGLHPLAGRLFGTEEELGTGEEVRALLTETAWRSHFGADPTVVGRTLRLGSGTERRPIHILGVVAGDATLPFSGGAQLLFPLATGAMDFRGDDDNNIYRLVARLRPGATMAQASDQITAVLREGGDRRHERFWVEPLRQVLQPAHQGLFLLLLGAAGLLLLLTAANTASLFLARALERSRETALRLALGAGLPQLLRSQLLEAGLVCGAALLLAFSLNEGLQSRLPILLPELKALGPELLNTGPALLAFAFAMTLIMGLAVSLPPLLLARNPHLPQVLAQGGRGASGGGQRGRHLLISAQVALTLVLLSLGTLLIRSLSRALHQDLGFDPTGVQVCSVALPSKDEVLPNAAFSPGSDLHMGGALPGLELAERAAALPGSQSASFAWQSPFGSGSCSTSMATHAGAFQPEDPHLPLALVGPAYFRTLGARLRAGREFTRAEVAADAPVAVLSESAARRLFPGMNPLARSVHSGLGGRQLQLIGIVEDLRSEGLDQAPRPLVYLPFIPLTGEDTVTLLVRTKAAPAPFARALGAQIHGWQAGASLEKVQALEALGAETVQVRSRAAILVGLFALLGLCIGAAGLYGTLAARAAEARREVGLRMALGATPWAAAGQLLGKGLRPVVFGALLGLGAAFLAAHLIRAQLYGVEAMDATSYVESVALLALGSFLAMLVPALRAAQVEPADALRSE